MASNATLNALIHGEQTTVSFRHLSTLLKIPKCDAQSLLNSYIDSQPKDSFSALWCVTSPHPKTGHLRTSLTTSPSPSQSKQIWAVGPPTAASAPSPHAVWFAADAARDRQLVAQPSHERNELRDGRWDPISSSSSTWNDSLDPRLGGESSLVKTEEKKNSTSLLSAAKAMSKAKPASKGKSNAKANAIKKGAFKPSSASSGSSSLFSSKRLGADSVARIRASDRESGAGDKAKGTKAEVKHEDEKAKDKGEMSNGRKGSKKKSVSGKKARRVVQLDSDEEGNGLDDDDEVDEEEERMQQMEKEAAEKEAADAERAELEREVMELTRKHDDEEEEEEEEEEEPESPILKEVKDEKREEVMSPGSMKRDETPRGGKRKFWNTLDEAPKTGRRIRKVVEELVEEGDYLVTKQVTKVFDENGNEVKDDVEKVEENTKKPDTKSPTSQFFTPLKQNKSQINKSLKTHSAGQKDKKRPPSKPGSSASKKSSKKKPKGNIMSYFSKKT